MFSLTGFRRGIAVSLTGASFFAFGCASLIGVEDRKDATTGADGTGGSEAEDPTDVETTPLCNEYCDEVMANCTGGDAVYGSRLSCINTCNALPPGLEAEPLGNTVECRLRKAKNASSAPGEECTAAGPGGEGGCGSSCEAWCHLLEERCPSDYDALVDCEASCGTIPDEGGFDVEGSYAKNDLQCRLIHLGAVNHVESTEIHCEHGRYIPKDKCLPAEDAVPSCDEYCDIALGNCRGSDAVYSDRSECMAVCAVLPLGEESDKTQNTVGCRAYHGRTAGLSPAAHCDHASPTGDGHCGTYGPDDSFTGNCESYCMLLEAGCQTDFDGLFTSIEECAVSCSADFADRGAANDTFYEEANATSSDSLQCRSYYSVKAVAGDAAACAKALPGGTCD